MSQANKTQGNTMNSRGEESFINMPRFGARLYDSLTRTRAIQVQFREVAEDLNSRISKGRLLDIGTGPGKLLLEVQKLNPSIELFGLDISEAMIKQAKKNLAGIQADLRAGNIRRTDYESDFFDLVTCTGSFYLWDEPVECLEEIHRILKSGQSAYLYETYKDINEDEFERALRQNLKKENLIRRIITPIFLKRQINMTYRIDKVHEIVRNTRFSESCDIERMTIAGLPLWMRIKLIKS
jgi:ubiquinone/menaquinone biosynthesis C-methylase UbiE